ncbi:MAG: HAMP domain-containing sensor histidine kinase [Chitinophagaceae bacterium]
MKPLLRNIFLNKYGLLSLAVLLFILSVIFNKVYTSGPSVIQEIRAAEKYLHHDQKDFDLFVKNTSLVRKLVSNKISKDEFEDFTRKNYGIFLYSINASGNWGLAAWSNQLVLPPIETFAQPDGNYFMHLANGHYFTEKKTFSIDGKPVLAIALILVRSDFFLKTDYLDERFVFSKTADKKVILSENPTEYPVKDLQGKTAFYLSKISFNAVPYNDKLTLVLRLSAFFLLLIFIHRYVESVFVKRGALVSISLLALLLLLFRVATYDYPSILNLRQFELFDPSVYGSNPVQRSLGDLLLNSILFCWFILFAWSKLRSRDNLIERFSMPLRWINVFLSLFLLIASTMVLASTIRSMVSDSKISFDVTDFFSLTSTLEYTVVGFIVLACLSLSYYYFTQLLFRFLFPFFQGRIYLIYFAIAFMGLFYLTLSSGNSSVLFYLPVLLWLLVYTWLISRQGLFLSRIRINVGGIIFWIFVFSVSISAIMLSENKKAEWARRKSYVEKLAVQTDPSSERMLNIAMNYIDNDFLFDNLYRFSNEEEGKKLRDSIINVNYRGYLDKFETKLFIYDSNDQGIFNEEPTPYAALNTILSVSSKPTNVPGLYFYESAYDKFTYITKRNIADTLGNKIGSVFIISNPKNYKSDALLPELFRQFKQGDPENSPAYSYAIYNDTNLVTFTTRYAFHTSILRNEIPKGEFELRSKGDYDELWFRASNKKIVVMVRKKDTIIETITLFSYIFCSFLFLVLLVQLISALLRIGAGEIRFKKLLQWNIRNQVQGTIISISILSFVIIGIATISFFITRYNRNNSDKLSRTMKIMVNEMQKKLVDHGTFDDVLPIYDSASNDNLQKLVKEVSDIHGVDVNVYDLMGNLKVSSEANVYNKGVLSKKINPMAFYHLNYLQEVQQVQEEKVGKLSYFSIYAPVRDEKGAMYAYINIPYFTSQQELNQEISNFLVTLINLNAFIFLISGIIALVIANRITRSFSFISEKMREVNLSKMNEQIEWNREDEIGELVKEYNKMVSKLGESAAALAKSEREGAWREMARQVAHEIKNPLTPMKLSIQYLQKAINSNQPNVKELSGNVADTLVEQIDHLSKIAADFSQFANIGITNVELFDLHDVISSLRELYRSDENIELNWHPVQEKILVKADKTQMNRLFTNLFANAIEACNGNPLCKIKVTEETHNGTVRISIRDNGEGIAEEMQSRIFIPNFTTKSSGTGLGLAMCKSIVEQAKGKIWFETKKNEGTTFHVELPLADNEF